MKKTALLNGPVSAIIADMGHGDTLCVCDAGMPISPKIQKVDLAVTSGIPSFLDVLKSIIEELFVEQVIIAEEMKVQQPNLFLELSNQVATLEARQGNVIPIITTSHDDLKKSATNCRASIRTGECVPYANVILQSGVPF